MGVNGRRWTSCSPPQPPTAPQAGDFVKVLKEYLSFVIFFYVQDIWTFVTS
jgi:hypothetical protein